VRWRGCPGRRPPGLQGLDVGFATPILDALLNVGSWGRLEPSRLPPLGIDHLVIDWVVAAILIVLIAVGIDFYY
jgi:hypothetical protein